MTGRYAAVRAVAKRRATDLTARLHRTVVGLACAAVAETHAGVLTAGERTAAVLAT